MIGKLFDTRRLSPGQLKKGLAELAASLRATIEADVGGFAVDPAASAERRARAFVDYRFFAQTYFPHYVKSEPSLMHEYVFARVSEVARSAKGELDALAAPRGEAKSTLGTQIHMMWRIARLIWVQECERILGAVGEFGKATRYGIIGMDSADQANGMLEAIKAELETNPRLKTDFPEMCGKGPVWREDKIVTLHGARIDAVGSGMKLRGRRHGPYRPDLVILDDIENDENVESPKQRDKTERWIDRAVRNLGSADGSMDIFYLGTVLHYDAAFARKLNNPAWRSKKFQAVIRWPDRMDLWEKWEELYRNAGEEAADLFLAAHRADMLRGAEVTWPTVRPFEKLMKLRIAVGQDSFDAELMNDPVALADAPFGVITFWVNTLNEWIKFGACDPSLGKNNAGGDPSAVLVGGFHREKQTLDTIEASIKRRLPTTIAEDMLSFQEEHRCLSWGIETVQFQHFFATFIQDLANKRGILMPIQTIEPHADKDLRILSLHPYWKNQQIRLHPSQKTLIDQARHYPKVDKRDGLDCLHMLWVIATGFTTAGDAKTARRGEGVATGYGGQSIIGRRRGGYGVRVGSLYGG